MPETIQEVVARIEKAMVEGVNRPGLQAEVPVSDLRRLIVSWQRRGRRIRELEGRL